MAVNSSIGRGAATAALACVLGVSMTPAAALADSGSGASGGGSTASAVVHEDGASSAKSKLNTAGDTGSDSGAGNDASGSGSGSGASGGGTGEADQGGTSGSGEQGTSGTETGSGQEGSGSSSSDGGESGAGTGSGEGNGSGSDSGSGTGSNEGTGTGSEGSGTGSGGDQEGTGSGSGAGSDSGSGSGSESGSGSGSESGSSSESGAGSESGSGASSGKPEVVLDLSASGTKVTVADVEAGQEPVVKVSFAGGSARTVTDGSAFAVTFFGPDGNKTKSFDEPGRYSVRVAAASSSATTSAGETVKGRSSLVFFQVKEKQAASSDESATTSTGNQGSAETEQGSKSSTQAASAGSATQSSAVTSSTASASDGASTGKSAAKDADAKSAATTATGETASKETKTTTRTYRYVASGKSGGVTYLAPVNLTSSSASARATAVGGSAASAVAGAAASGVQAASGSYSLDEASTDVSAIVTQAAGAEVLFWGGGTEVAPGYIWSVDTSAMTRDDAFGLDLKVAPCDAAERLAKGVDATALRVEQTGPLPAGLCLFWRTSSVFFDGETVDVYRVDPQTGACSIVSQGLQTADGYVGFDVAEGGEYIVAESGADLGEDAKLPSITEILVPAEAYADNPASDAVAAAAPDDGTAGDLWALPAGIAAALASAGAVWLAMRRKFKSALGGGAEDAQDE